MTMTTLRKMVKAITSWMEVISSVDEFSKVSVDKAEKGLMGVIHDCMYINNSKKFWRQISKICKRWNVRVVDVLKEAY